MPSDDGLDEFVEQIAADAYGDEGYWWSLLQAFEDEIHFPIPAAIAGKPVRHRARLQRTTRHRRHHRTRRPLRHRLPPRYRGTGPRADGDPAPVRLQPQSVRTLQAVGGVTSGFGVSQDPQQSTGGAAQSGRDKWSVRRFVMPTRRLLGVRVFA